MLTFIFISERGTMVAQLHIACDAGSLLPTLKSKSQLFPQQPSEISTLLRRFSPSNFKIRSASSSCSSHFDCFCWIASWYSDSAAWNQLTCVPLSFSLPQAVQNHWNIGAVLFCSSPVLRLQASGFIGCCQTHFRCYCKTKWFIDPANTYSKMTFLSVSKWLSLHQGGHTLGKALENHAKRGTLPLHMQASTQALHT